MFVSWTDRKLFQALKAHQPEALQRLYDLYADLMYSLALHILMDPQEAAELIQGVLTAQWQKCTYNPVQNGSLKTFLLLRVRACALKRLKERLPQSNRSPTNTLVQSAPLDKPMVTDVLTQQVRSALQKLPEEQRQVVLLSFFEGLTPTEIAQQLELPCNQVKRLLHSGVWALQKVIPISRKIEHSRQQLQNASSSFWGEASQ